MFKSELKSIVLSQQEWLSPEINDIKREKMDNLTTLFPFSFFLTGVRRSGKSTLLKQLMQFHGARNFLNFEDSRITDFEITDFLLLEDIYSELFGDNKIFFYDEIQNVSGWERYVRDAVDRKKVIVLTGSNARLLSRELGTKLTGRHLDYEVFPFSYREYLTFSQTDPRQDSLLKFIVQGGFPGYLKTENKELLSMLVSDILLRDVFTRYHLRNIEIYKRILQFLLSNTGKEVSFNNLKNTFELGSANSVMEFLNYLIDAYLIFLVPRWDTSLKVQAKNPRKVYAIDQGLVNFSSVSGSPDLGRLLENTVFLELRRKGLEIWYFRGKKECDFIYRDPDKKLHAMQVCWQVSSSNQIREINGLVEAMDAIVVEEGIILTFDQEDLIKVQEKSIRIIPAWKWLVDKIN
jgi:predicted AAA+ superfamily ATPase